MNYRTVLWLLVFALAMALVEAAIVVHLRHLYYAEDPLTLFPLKLLNYQDLALELAREVATVVMLIVIAVLSAETFGRRFAAFVLSFGLWDLFYYLWLKIFLDWPQTWLEWDILFLIPWMWLGPWITPALIAVLFVIWGGWVLLTIREPHFTWRSLAIFLFGSFCGLTSFLLPAALLLPAGEEAFIGYMPGTFNWTLYSIGWLAMAVGLFDSVNLKNEC